MERLQAAAFGCVGKFQGVTLIIILIGDGRADGRADGRTDLPSGCQVLKIYF